MYIKDLFNKKKPVVSFEIFPPNYKAKINSIYKTIEKLAELQPDYMSVTYGASGLSETKNLTIDLASYIKSEANIEPLAHLTCITSTKQQVDYQLRKMKDLGIDNILALRGDLPERKSQVKSEYNFASDLIAEMKNKHEFSIGAACHPEGHKESKSKILDLIHLKQKVDCGADFLVSQLFFDNKDFYSFLKEVRLLGINIPIVAGIMPVVNTRQIEKITNLCGARVPAKFQKIMSRYQYNKEALYDAGIAYASEQIIDLLSSGVDGIHIYAMNRPSIARRLIENISSVVRVLNLEIREKNAV